MHFYSHSIVFPFTYIPKQDRMGEEIAVDRKNV